ncbi:signal transduction histidine kinase/CheY-like chemotaxis protein [Flavobacterium sp. 7E]|uniref:response regulator n=1 Tax=Flavobacterium sp. 7E TaxID=2735898 RepID=UPI00157117DC|nr:response regulator [Flavobacterium sp. 7E]NRS88791.1 signal transduction histidine kinase/CheY-like chemotaxis protein [Flavobacterium sp. 7E]
MLNSQALLLILYSFFFFSDNPISEKPIPSRSEVLKITKDATNYLNENNFEKSFVFSRLALHYAISMKDDYLIAKSYNIIASNYESLAETDKAIFYFKKGLFYANKTDNDTIKNGLNNNLGNIYSFGENDFNKGLYYYKKSLGYSNKIGSQVNVFITKMNITWAYFYKNDFENGYAYLDYLNKNKDRYADNSDLMIVNMLNGMYYSNKNDFAKANSYFENAVNIGGQLPTKDDVVYVYEEYAKLLLKHGDYKRAYENLAIYNIINKDIYNSEKLRRTNVAGVNLELDEYKRKIDLIETENDLQSKSLQKTKIINILVVIALIVLLILLYTLYKSYTFKKKSNADLILKNEELKIAKDKAEVASQLKSQFVSTISHELRTPLYGVIGITNLLSEEHKELADSPHLNSLKFSARYLLSLVNDVLQINKIEENRIVLERLAFNINDEIKLINDSLAFIAENHHNTVTINIDPEIPEYLIGDKLRFSQIMINLLSNALKFTQNGSILLEAKLEKVEVDTYFIAFKVQDNGIGIAVEDQEKIFEKFSQVSRQEIDYQGTGLGLPIVKRLLELFNSSIIIESELDKGTTFRFVIPFEYDPYKTIETFNNNNLDLQSGESYSVLVVDDNKINQLVTKKIIENNNYKCTIVDSGFAALDALETEIFDVILMDINMPLMNGFETTRKIRQRGVVTAIVALTAFDKEEITEEAISAGFNDIIIKPFDPVLLFKTINNLIHSQNEEFLV